MNRAAIYEMLAWDWGHFTFTTDNLSRAVDEINTSIYCFRRGLLAPALRRLSPGTAEVHARLGLIYFQQGKFAEAVVPLREALRLKPDLPKLDALLAMSLSELGKYEEALPAR